MARTHTGRDDVMGKVALGATGIALAAGGIAAAVMLSNRKNRATVKKAAGKTFKKLGRVKEAIKGGADRYQAFTHRIDMNKNKAKMGKKGAKKTSKGRKTTPAILHKIDMGKGKGKKSKA